MRISIPLGKPFEDMADDEDIYNYLSRTGRFSDFILMCSSHIKLYVDDAILKEYNLTRSDKRSDQLLSNLSLARKIEILRKLGTITQSDFKIMDKFRLDRNRLVHELGLMRLFFLSKEEKDDYMKGMRVALDVMFGVLQRLVPASKSSTEITQERK